MSNWIDLYRKKCIYLDKWFTEDVTAGPFGSKQPTQLFGSALTSNNLNFNSGVMNVGSSLPSFSQAPSPFVPSSASNLLTTLVNGAKDAANAAE